MYEQIAAQAARLEHQAAVLNAHLLPGFERVHRPGLVAAVRHITELRYHRRPRPSTAAQVQNVAAVRH